MPKVVLDNKVEFAKITQVVQQKKGEYTKLPKVVLEKRRVSQSA